MQTLHMKRVRCMVVGVAAWFIWALYCLHQYHKALDCDHMDRYGDDSAWAVSTDVLKADVPPAKHVTMVTTMFPEALPSFVRMVEHWTGPVSVAVYAPSDQPPDDFVNAWISHPHLGKRTDIILSLVLQQGSYYPRNLLTDVALRQVRTDYVYVAEVGDVPCPDLHARLQHYINGRLGMIRNMPWQQGLVVPVFEGAGMVPHNKSQLLHHLAMGQMQPHQPKLMFNSHDITNYDAWETAIKPYDVYYRKGYSPNIVLGRNALPSFMNRIVGKDFDRLAFHAELYVKGVRLTVLHDVFAVRSHDYLIHSESTLRFLDQTPAIRCIAQEFLAMRSEMEHRYCEPNVNLQKTCRKQQVWDMVDRIHKVAYG